MIQKIFAILKKLFYITLLILPFLCGGILSFIYLSGLRKTAFGIYNEEYYLLPTMTNGNIGLVSCILLFLIIVFITNEISTLIKRHNEKHADWLCAIIIFSVAFGMRWIFLAAFGEDIQPFSDFKRIWNLASGEIGELNYYQNFPAWVNFAMILRELIKFFGISYKGYLWLNVLLNSFTTVCVFKLTLQIIQNRKISMLAGLIYACMPSVVIYNLVATPEIMAICFNLIALVFIFMLHDEVRYGNKIVYGIMGGCMLGIANSIKPFSTVIIVAGMIWFVYRIVERKLERRIFIKEIVLILVIVTLSNITTEMITMVSEKAFETSLDSSSATMHYLMVGLNTKGEGQTRIGNLSRSYINSITVDGVTVEEAKVKAIELLKNDWHENRGEIVPLFGKKIIWAWQDDVRPVTFLLNYLHIDPDTQVEKFIWNFSSEYMVSLAEGYYFWVMFFGLIGVIYIKKYCMDDNRIFFLSLIIFGYVCLVLLSEAQSRYKCLIMPLVCIIASLGINELRIKVVKYVKTRKLLKSRIEMNN